VVAIGGHAIHVPYRVTWSHELVEPTPEQQGRFAVVESIDAVPALVQATAAA
jgi:putative hydrolase of the HAD superfamily